MSSMAAALEPPTKASAAMAPSVSFVDNIITVRLSVFVCVRDAGVFVAWREVPEVSAIARGCDVTDMAMHTVYA